MKTFTMSAVFVAVMFAASGGTAAEPAPVPRVEWEGKVFPAFERAVKEKKLLVVYFRKDYCEPSKGPCRHCAPIDAVLTGPRVGELADKAVWVWQSVGVDDEKGNVNKLMKQLKIDAVPVVVVLEPSREQLKEVGRVVGKHTEAEMARRFHSLLKP